MDEEPDGEVEQQESDEFSREGSMEVDEEPVKQPAKASSPASFNFRTTTSSAGGFDWAEYGSSVTGGTPRGIKRSRGGATISSNSPRPVAKERAPRRNSPIPAISKDMATQLGIAKLDEPDRLIMKTEAVLKRLYDAAADARQDYEVLLSNASQELCKIWQESREQNRKEKPPSPEHPLGIGPDESEPDHHKADFLGSLLLQLHHPPAARGLQAFAVSKFGRSSIRDASPAIAASSFRPTSLPKVLLDWLNENHDPYANSAAALRAHPPNPTAHMNYWDIIFSSTLRGKISDVIRIFKLSSFDKACTAREDGQDQDGYQGTTLGNIKRVIDRAVQVLEMCPALQDEDWDVAGNEWLLFRKRIEHAMADLTTFAEGRNRYAESAGPMFEASNFGIKSPSLALSQSARRAESQVPWTVYQNLKTMYGIILGGTAEIISSAQDWVEATIGLAAWWNGDEDEGIAVSSLAVTRRSLRRSQSRGARLVDLNPTEAYLQRLAYAFELVTDDESEAAFQISSINPMEVGLASIFEGNVEGVIGLLRGWSLPIASAVVEVACFGSWYNPTPSHALVDTFDESDLLVLSSYGQRDKPISQDSVLIDYAEALFNRDRINDTAVPQSTEGWECSIQLLARLHDTRRAERKVNELLEKLPLDSDLKVDRIMDICIEFGLEEEALRLAEVRPYNWTFSPFCSHLPSTSLTQSGQSLTKLFTALRRHHLNHHNELRHRPSILFPRALPSKTKIRPRPPRLPLPRPLHRLPTLRLP